MEIRLPDCITCDAKQDVTEKKNECFRHYLLSITVVEDTHQHITEVFLKIQASMHVHTCKATLKTLPDLRQLKTSK